MPFFYKEEIMEYMYLVIPILFLIIEAVIGYKRGLVLSVLSLLSWIISVGGSALLVKEFFSSDNVGMFSDLFAGLVGEDNALFATLAALFILLAIMLKLFCLIIMHFAKKIDDVPVLSTVNRILGALFGILKGLLVIVLLAFAFAVYSGMYLDWIYDKYPQLMVVVDTLQAFLREMWINVNNM